MKAAIVLALGLLLPAASVAQPAAGTSQGDIPDVPAGPASIQGKIVREGGSGAVADLEVVLYALPQGAAPGLRRTRSSADGRFAFEGISSDPTTSYLVGARVGEVPFPGERITFAQGELSREVDIRIAEATSDPAPISVADVKLRLDAVGGRLVVTETHRLRNTSTWVFHVAAAERARRAPAFRTSLPAGATELTGPLGILPEGVVRRENTLDFFGPLYPGEQDLTFSYALPVQDGATTLRKRFPTGAPGVRVAIPSAGPSVAAPALTAGENVSLEGRDYRTLVGAALKPGAELALEITLPAAQDDPAALSVQEVRAFLELDGAALTVREEHRLTVSGDRVLTARGDAPLYRIGLPEDARDIRFATDPPGISLVPAMDGGIAVAGPLPAGPTTIELLYHVPAPEGRRDVTLASSLALPLLSIYVADTGLNVRSDRLHRRRPVKTEDRMYLALEAFEIEPGEKVPLALERIDRGAGRGRNVALASAVVAALAALGLLVAPLRRPEGAVAAEEEPAAHGEREALYANMRDLEDDFETGKLSESDHTLLRDELRGRAATLLQAEREAKRDRPRPAVAPPAPRFCTNCGSTLAAADRFCAQCGAKVAPASLEASA